MSNESLSTALVATTSPEQGAMEEILRGMGYFPVRVDGAASLDAVRLPVSVCLVDLRQDIQAMRIARAVRSQFPLAIVIGLADPARPTAASEAVRAGVFDVLPRPASARDLEALLANAREQSALAIEHPGRSESDIIGVSPAMGIVVELAQRAAAGRCGILICGERGTGREMLARAVHAHGNRRAPFVRLDCAASTPEEIEIRVFGSPTARTAAGAPERHRIERIGSTCLLAEAHGGILFIKNITEMPARVQARLVRVLRDREVFLEDASESSPIQVRPIVAGDGTIGAAVEEGQLRADLYERISLIRIDVPPLRQRREDIPVLAAHLLKDLCRAHAVPMKTLTRSASTLLSALPWRGNIPELSGLVERLVLVVPQGLIRLEDVLSHTQLEGTASRSGADTTLREARIRFEREYISSVLQRHNGRIADAARTLGIQRTNLYRMMRRLNLALPRSVDRER